MTTTSTPQAELRKKIDEAARTSPDMNIPDNTQPEDERDYPDEEVGIESPLNATD